MKLKILKSMHGNIPFEENSISWHVWLDCCSVGQKMAAGEVLDMDKMIRNHGTSLEYYDNGLSELLDKGYLTVIKES